MTERFGRVLSLALAVVPAACADTVPRAGAAANDVLTESVEAPVWNAPDSTLFDVGSEGTEAYQFDRVRGALRLPDGGVVVLDGGSSELRYFDSRGIHVLTAGGKGEGPGEFGVAWALYRRGDTIVVTDSRRSRLSLFTTDGSFIGTAPGDAHGGTGNVYLHDASVVVGAPDAGGRESTTALIERLPRPETYVREVRVAGPGSVWLRRDQTGAGWLLVDGDAQARHEVVLPPDFTLFEVGVDYMLGMHEDSLGVQSVRVLPVPVVLNATSASSGTTRANGAAAADTAQLAELLEQVALYQEYYYSRPDAGYVYAETVEELASFDPPPEARLAPIVVRPGTVLRITRSGQMGWFGVAADTASGRACATGSGFEAPTGWTNGVLACF